MRILGVYSIILVIIASMHGLKDTESDTRLGALMLAPILVYLVLSFIN